MNDFQHSIQIFSIVAIIAPIGIGLIKLKRAGFELRLLLAFLMIGLSTDLTMYYLVHVNRTSHLLGIFNIYSLIESLFFYWFIWRNIRSVVFEWILNVLFFVTPLFWLFFIVLFPGALFTQATASQVFDTVYEITAAFFSGFALLKMVEREDAVLLLPNFWILLGIFFYCFCTFFIMSFLNTVLSQQIWFLNHLVNILVYIIFSIGLWKSGRSTRVSF
ncbi:MAG TPA: hypothetical protein VFW11_23230 [Cyclobacteriaceae bacterium]|nr:hypothetical protein [Cyclobacteriaceae bacterium]